MDCVKKVRLVSRRIVQPTVTKLEKWIRDQISPSIYILWQTIGYSAFRDIILGEKERVENNPQKILIINDYFRKKKLDEEKQSFWRVRNKAKHFLEKYGFELENEDTWERWGPVWADDKANEVYRSLSAKESEYVKSLLKQELKGEFA